MKQVPYIGARDFQVDELFSGVNYDLKRPDVNAVLVIDLKAYLEPKILNPRELKALIKRFGGSQQAADAVGASEAFVRQNVKAPR